MKFIHKLWTKLNNFVPSPTWGLNNELQKLYPENVEGTIPTIAEIEDAIVIPDVEENQIDNK